MFEASLERVRHALISVGVLFLLTVSAFVFVENWTFVDSLYMTSITFTTIGYGAPHDLSATGKLLIVPVTLSSFVSMTLLTAYVTSFIVENDLSGHFAQKRTRKMLKKLQNHVIVCGSGKMAEVILGRLLEQKVKVVVVDIHKERLQELRLHYPQGLYFEGNPTNEIVLSEVRLITAKYVVAALESEVDNLLVSITCKDLGSDIKVFARSNDFSIGNRMRKAHVDEVITPCKLCGDKVADLILALEQGDHAGNNHEIRQNHAAETEFDSRMQLESLPNDQEMIAKLTAVGFLGKS